MSARRLRAGKAFPTIGHGAKHLGRASRLVALSVIVLFHARLGAFELEIESSNDALSWYHRSEWDDSYTAGMRLAIRDDWWWIDTGLAILTLRARAADEVGTRVDELSIRSGFRLQDAYLKSRPARLTIDPWLQTSFYGDFGGLELQQATHQRAGLTRPVPTTYVGIPPELVAGTAVELSWPFPADLTAATSIEAIGRVSLPGACPPSDVVLSAPAGGVSGRLRSGILVAYGEADSRLEVETGWVWGAGVYDGLDDAALANPLAASRSMMGGPYLKTVSATGWLRVTRYSYMSSGWGWGAVSAQAAISSPSKRPRPSAPMLTQVATRLDGLSYTQRTTLYLMTLGEHGSSDPTQRFARVGGGALWSSGWLGVGRKESIERIWGVWTPAEGEVGSTIGPFTISGYLSLGPGVEVAKLFGDSSSRAMVRGHASYLSIRSAVGLRTGVIIHERSTAGIGLELARRDRTRLPPSSPYSPELPGWEVTLSVFGADR